MREQRERQRTRVVERARGDVHRVRRQEAELGEQRAHRAGVGAGAHRPLRLAGGARRVDHRRPGRPACALGVDRRRIGLRGHELVPLRAAGRRVAAEHQHAADLRELIAHCCHERCLLGVDEHDGRVGVVDHVLHLGGVEAVRDRDRREPDLAAGMEGGDHLERVRAAPRDALAAARARARGTRGRAGWRAPRARRTWWPTAARPPTRRRSPRPCRRSRRACCVRTSMEGSVAYRHAPDSSGARRRARSVGGDARPQRGGAPRPDAEGAGR